MTIQNCSILLLMALKWEFFHPKKREHIFFVQDAFIYFFTKIIFIRNSRVEVYIQNVKTVLLLD